MEAVYSIPLFIKILSYCISTGGYKVQPPSVKAYWQNTFVTASRAMTDYLLDLE